jgi:SHS2 domain-containing protein
LEARIILALADLFDYLWRFEGRETCLRHDKRFEFLEHTADVYIAAYGATLEEAFENAALATFEVMTDTEKIKQKIEDAVKVEAPDEQALLYTWLEQLLISFETKGNVYSGFKIPKIERTKSGFMFTAIIRGEPFNQEKHPQRVGVKAITYHRMEIDRKPGTVSVKFILDI